MGTRNALKDLRSHIPTGNAGPVLREIQAALEALLETGQETTIDLGALPFSAGDERQLEEVLGSGEVKATLDIFGTSHVQETGIPGVWRIDHFDQRGETLSRFVEVTLMPEILKTQRADAEDGLARLAVRLEERDSQKH